jgi:hypothetical protein
MYEVEMRSEEQASEAVEVDDPIKLLKGKAVGRRCLGGGEVCLECV